MIAFVMVPRPRPFAEDGVPKAHVIVLLGQVNPNRGVTELCSGTLIFGQATPTIIPALLIMVIVVINATADDTFFFPMHVPDDFEVGLELFGCRVRTALPRSSPSMARSIA